MSSNFDKNLLPEFDSIKDNDEEILWSDKPNFTPYLFSGIKEIIFMFAFGLIWILFYYNLLPGEIGNNQIIKDFAIFGLIPVIQALYFILKRLLSYSNTAYGYSNKRVMMRTGFIGTDFKTIDYDKISDIEVTVNIIERIFNVGTIRFFSGRTKTDDDVTSKLYDNWISISNPYEVFKMLKQTSIDIKTDFNYPNALRPNTNPGYKTKYQRVD
jgi:membrane protein YdbS with pleckstrin-like domain